MNINQITYAKKTVAQYEILEERYLSKNSGKERSDDSNFYLTEEAMADYDFDKMIKSDDRATSMEIIAGKLFVGLRGGICEETVGL